MKSEYQRCISILAEINLRFNSWCFSMCQTPLALGLTMEKFGKTNTSVILKWPLGLVAGIQVFGNGTLKYTLNRSLFHFQMSLLMQNTNNANAIKISILELSGSLNLIHKSDRTKPPDYI